MTYPWSEPTWICCPNWVCCEVLRLVIVQIISNKADLEGQGVDVDDWGLLRAMRCSRWDLWVQAKTIFITLPAGCWFSTSLQIDVNSNFPIIHGYGIEIHLRLTFLFTLFSISNGAKESHLNGKEIPKACDWENVLDLKMTPLRYV